jgi:hypothetical protein
MNDQQIEDAFTSCGGQWDGSRWIIEDADLHPFARTLLAAAPQAAPAPAPQALTEREPLANELFLAAQSAITCSYADHGRRSVNLQAWNRLIQAVAVVTHGIGAASAGGEG